MAEIKTLQIDVKDDQVQALSTGLDEIGVKFRIVERETGKTNEGFKRIGKSSFVFQQLNKWTGGLAGNLVDVYNGLTKFNAGLTVTRGALIATGIGAFVVALGVVVAYWDDIVNFITQADEKLQEQIDLLGAKGDLLNAEFKVLDEQQKLLEAQGESTDDLIEKKKLLLQAQIGIAGAELALLQTQQERLENQAKELTFWEKVLNFSFMLRGLPTVGGTVTPEEQLGILEGRKGIQERIAGITALQTTLEGLINPKSKTKGGKREKQQKINPITGESYDAEIEQLSEHFREVFDLDAEAKKALQESSDQALERLVTSEEYAQARRTKAEEQGAEARKRIAEREAEAKRYAYMLAADGFEAASTIIGEQTAAGKALAVASATISTYLAAQRAYESVIAASFGNPALATAAAATAVLQGLARVKQILAVNVPGGVGSSPVTGPSAPSFNVVAASGQNQLNQALIERDTAPVEAFVTEGTISSAQELKRKKVSASSI